MSPYLFQVLLSLYLVAAPTIGFGTGLSWHDEQRIGQISLFIIISFWLLCQAIRNNSFPVPNLLGRQVTHTILLIALFGLFSAATAPLPRWAFLEWSTTGLLTLLAFSFAGIRRTQRSRFDYWWMGVCITSAAAYLTGFMVAYSAVFLEGLPLFVWQLFNGFSNIRFFGHFQSMTLPLLVLPALIWPVKLYQRWALAVLCSGWWMLAIASGTRGTWLGMGFAFLISMLCLQSGHRWLRAQINFLFIGALGYILFFEALPALLGIERVTIASSRFSNITSLSGREILWWQALDIILAYPVLGVGPMHLAFLPNGIAAHPHNAILQWAAEWGLPSATLLTFGILLGLRSLFRRICSKSSGSERSLLRVALFLSLIAALTQSLVDGVIVMPYSQTWLAIITGWAIGVHYDDHDHQSSERTSPANIWPPTLAALLWVGVIFYGTHDDIGRLKEREIIFMQKHGGITMPRYWEQGVIFE